ncbi:MAG: HAMP domain-containing histidine kinase [Bacteroidales bacterium]|jgi:signal transduction histidine kinase|nr:HAMP domain-containing histidine kinase [Bacteroidales bacterium]
MKVQTRLSLFSSIVFGIIFIIIAVLIYGLYSNNTKNGIYSDLEKTALITAYFYLEEDELNTEEFESVKKQFKELVLNTYYQIYNVNNIIVWGAEFPVISTDLLDKIRQKQKLEFTDTDYLCYGIFYEDNQGDFVVITKEKRALLTGQMRSLLWILVILFLIGIIAIVLLSMWMASIAYRPFSKVVNQVKNIPVGDESLRIESPDTHDELQNLTETFNELLERISETMIIRKNFVRYVTHEFKTPLTAMLGNLEVFSIKDRSPDEYDQLAQKLITQIHQLEEILDTLMVISDLRKDSPSMSPMRIDELIWEIIAKLSDNYPQSKIMVSVDIKVEDEAVLNINVDAMQLLMALYNLLENAVKYSQGITVEARLYKQGEYLHLSITDKGIGIPADQLSHVSKPFYRADNANQMQGSGIGLSIALRILEKNNIAYQIESEEGKGTRVELFFKN